jgi:hypothetical protein
VIIRLTKRNKKQLFSVRRSFPAYKKVIHSPSDALNMGQLIILWMVVRIGEECNDGSGCNESEPGRWVVVPRVPAR